MEAQAVVKQSDSRILREALCKAEKYASPAVKKWIYDALIKFAENVQEYCQCPEKVYIEKEKTFGCLDCGKRTQKPIEVVNSYLVLPGVEK